MYHLQFLVLLSSLIVIGNCAPAMFPYGFHSPEFNETDLYEWLQQVLDNEHLTMQQKEEKAAEHVAGVIVDQLNQSFIDEMFDLTTQNSILSSSASSLSEQRQFTLESKMPTVSHSNQKKITHSNKKSKVILTKSNKNCGSKSENSRAATSSLLSRCTTPAPNVTNRKQVLQQQLQNDPKKRMQRAAIILKSLFDNIRLRTIVRQFNASFNQQVHNHLVRRIANRNRAISFDDFVFQTARHMDKTFRKVNNFFAKMTARLQNLHQEKQH